VESEQPRAEINNHDANGELFQCLQKARVFPQALEESQKSGFFTFAGISK
jgi:hypothetical protein